MISEHVYTADVGSLRLPVLGGTISLDVTRSPRVAASIRIAYPGGWATKGVPLPNGDIYPLDDIYPPDDRYPFDETYFAWPVTATWNYFDAAHAGLTWDEIDARYAGQTWDDFDSGAWVNDFPRMVLLPVWVPDGTVLDRLDPREAPRVTVRAGIKGHAPRSFDLHLRRRSVDRTAAVITLDLASDEGLLEDFAPLSDDTAPASLTTLRAVVDYVIGQVLPGEALEPGDSGDGSPVAGDADDAALVWSAGTSGMSFLQPLVQRAGLRLVCDEQRRWTLRDEAHEADGSLSLRHGVQLIEEVETIDRDQGLWFDARVTRYRWRDVDGLQQERVDSYTLTLEPTRVTTLDISAAYPGPGRSEYAVRRAQGLGREITVAIVSDWNAEAEQAVSITLPDTPAQLGKTQQVTFDLDTDEMTIVSRTTDTPDGAINLLTGTITSLTGTIDEL